jgi:SAM-dependent methyltransferase
MPTIPSARPPRPEAHHHREVAESFGSDAGRYNRARPSYPDALVHRIITPSPSRGPSPSHGSSPNRSPSHGSDGQDVLDVGCGTGIAARLFQAVGCRVLGVDPDARMAELARQTGLEVEVATFEAWDPAGRAFDAVVAGQAWHWVDPVAGAAKAAQALRPGGRLALFWNSFQPPSELGEAFAAAYRRVVPDFPVFQRGMPGPEAYSVLCDKAADGMRQAGAFGPSEQWRFDWDRPYTRDEWLDTVPTFGGHSQLPPARQRELLASIGAAIDAAGGSFTMHYATVAVTAARVV